MKCLRKKQRGVTNFPVTRMAPPAFLFTKPFPNRMSVNARAWRDQITVFTKILTRAYAAADHVRVEAVFYPD